MTLTQAVSDAVSKAFILHGHDEKFGRVNVSDRPDLSQYQCSGAFAACKVARRSPKEISGTIAGTLAENALFSKVSADGGGFINLSVADHALTGHVAALAADARLGHTAVTQPEQVILDFGGPNVAKAMHVGHLRSTIIGDSLQRLFRFAGHHVTSDIHLGDWGTQMGMLISEMQREQPQLPYFDPAQTGPYPAESPVTLAELGEMYPRASARAKSNPVDMQAARLATAELQSGRPGYRALWEHFVDVSHRGLQVDFASLKVYFDLWYGESTVRDMIPGLVEAMEREGFAKESEGALVIPLRNGQIPPLILRKSDGAAIYTATDLATIQLRVNELHAGLILYVVDNRQSLHFEQVFDAAQLTGIAKDARLEHIKFGTLNGEDGKPFKTREGGVLSLRDFTGMVIQEASKRIDEAGLAKDLDAADRQVLAEKVGLAALKFADLQHMRTSDYIFRLDKFTTFEGCTGPYLQYAAVRVKSILRKAQEQGLPAGVFQPPANPAERNLVLALCRFPDAIDQALETRMPHHLCDYVYNLSRDFSRFYESCQILREPDVAQRGSWLSVVELSLRVIEQTLSLLGIEIPDRM